jgi:hypothetical protein
MDETLIDGLAIIGAIACVIWFIQGIKALRSKLQSQPEAPVGTGSAETASAVETDDMAVIAAAVYALLGRQHVVHLDNSDRDPTWAAEGRWMQQTSHAPH